MPSRLSTFLARLLPNGPLDVVRQAVLFVTAFQLYRLTRGLVDNPEAATTAFSNARDLIHAEQALNIFVEPSLQAFAGGQQWLLDGASWMYVNSQTSITLGALTWLYLFRNDLVQWRALKVFWSVYPLVVVFVIVVTANHFIADAVLGAAAAGIGALTAGAMARARPQVWMFDPAQAHVQPAQATAAP